MSIDTASKIIFANFQKLLDLIYLVYLGIPFLTDQSAETGCENKVKYTLHPGMTQKIEDFILYIK